MDTQWRQVNADLTTERLQYQEVYLDEVHNSELLTDNKDEDEIYPLADNF